MAVQDIAVQEKVVRNEAVQAETALSEYDRWLYRIGGGLGIAGALLGLVGNLLHPATTTGDIEGTARVIAESDGWVAVHFTIVVGLILMLGGLAAIYHSIRGGLPGALMRLGFVAGVVGATVGLILVIVDGIAAKSLADRWAVAPPDEQSIALGMLLTEETINVGLASLFNVLFAGVTFIFYGLAVALSNVYPRWLGWVVMLAAVIGVVAGGIQAYVGDFTEITRILTIITPTIITLWLMVMGFLLVRKAARE
ncbi:MAG TPA: DUF4386 family protein [Chloroflexia bacterium]|nr:DUF4386 family protein [Chloroflexia bacterium]